MSSYLTNLLTTTTSRYGGYASLKSLLPTGHSETDGDTEDDTHICRVLRAYYIEKGRPFPGWLPPDPKAPPPATVQPVYSGQQVGAGYGGLGMQGAGAAGGGSKLGSLWDRQPPPQQAAPQSLRAGRGVASQALRGGVRQDPYSRNQQSVSAEQPVQARPLPSQRAGSHQSAGRNDLSRTGSGSSVGSGTGTGTAQDRLKARLWGGAKAATAGASQERTPSPAGGGYGAPAARPGYDERTQSGQSAASGRSDRPYVAANSPWTTNEDEFAGGGGAVGNRRYGLPSGPRAMR
jgi:hypothetical protein